MPKITAVIQNRYGILVNFPSKDGVTLLTYQNVFERDRVFCEAINSGKIELVPMRDGKTFNDISRITIEDHFYNENAR